MTPPTLEFIVANAKPFVPGDGRWNVTSEVKDALLARSAAFGLGDIGPGREYREQLEAFEQGTGPAPSIQLSNLAAKICDSAVRNHLMAESQNQRDEFYEVDRKLRQLSADGGSGGMSDSGEVARIILAIIDVERSKRSRAVERGEIIVQPKPLIGQDDAAANANVVRPSSPTVDVSPPAAMPPVSSSPPSPSYGDQELSDDMLSTYFDDGMAIRDDAEHLDNASDA